MTHRLDDQATYAIDASGMFRHIERLGSEFEAAWLASSRMPTPHGSFDNMVIAAMGGSAAAADYFATHASKESAFPVEVARGYALPGYVSSRTLVVALSYSGNTEETLACYAEAEGRGAARYAISTGGELQTRAEAAGEGWHQVKYDSPPRAALGHTLAALLRIGQRLGTNSLCDPDARDVADAHRSRVADHVGAGVQHEKNVAKQFAELLAEASPIVIFGSEHLAPVGLRTKNQFAENAKVLSSFEELPEASHNIIVGLEQPGEGNPAGLSFDSPKLNPANRRRAELVAGMFEVAGGAMAALPARGISRLADMLEATAWADYLSCYLALLRGIDPTPTPSLDRVRGAMAAVEAPAK